MIARPRRHATLGLCFALAACDPGPGAADAAGDARHADAHAPDLPDLGGSVEPPDLGGSGAHDARPPVPDGGADGDDARRPDASGLDAGADGGSTLDAGADAGSTSDAGAPPDAAAAPLCALALPAHALGPNGGALDLDFESGEGLAVSPACGPGAGREHIVALPLAGPARVEARLTAPSGGVQLSARTTCDAPETELACTAPAFDAAALVLDFGLDGPQTVFFIAEGAAFEPAARANLVVTVWPPESPPRPDVTCPAADAPLTARAAGGRMAIDTRGKADVFPSCLGEGFVGGPEQIVLLKVDTPSRLLAETSHTAQDTVLGLWAACEPQSPARFCDDDSGPGTLSRLERARLEPGFWYLSVEAAGPVAAEGGEAGLVCELDVFLTPLPPDACADAFDNDADGRTDADDPGCGSARDADETDPAMPADCADALDNDADGRVDADDPDCPYAGANAETGLCGAGVSVRALALDGTPTLAGNDAGRSGEAGAQALPCGPAEGLDELFSLTLPERSRVELFVEDAAGRPPVTVAGFDGCDAEAPALACRPPLSVSPLRLDDHPAGTVFFAVRRAADAPAAPYTVRAAVESLVRACNDGVDGDADGLVDLFDPGCAYDFDDDEVNDPDPATWPACADGRDNDDDGAVDYPADSECFAAGAESEEPSCATDVPLTRVTAPGGRLNLQTSGRDRYLATCGNPTGPEQAVAVRVDVPSDLSVVVENNDYDTVVFVRAACDDADAELACNDDTNGLASAVTLENLQPGTYFVFLDGYAGASGHAELVVTLTPRGGLR